MKTNYTELREARLADGTGVVKELGDTKREGKSAV